jgi:predicted ATPase
MLPLHTKQLVEQIFEFEHLGPVSVKGMDFPIDCWLVVGQRTEGHKPARTVFIGREEELAALSEVYAKAHNSFQIIGLKGDAGIGKSRLIQEFCAALDSTDVLRGTCSSISPTPFNLFTRILEEQFQIRHNIPTADRKSRLEAEIQALAGRSSNPEEILDTLPLLGLLLEIRYPDPRVKQKGKDLLNHILRAIELILMTLIRNAQGRTLVLILDDIHLIDEASAQALCHLISKIDSEGISLMMIAMYRLDYQILECLTAHPSFTELEISALSEDKINDLVQHYTRDMNLSDTTLKLVRELSAGNPFFLEEWCNYIANLPKTELDEYPVPGNLHALILSRLDNLPQKLRLLLHKASVIGNVFFVEILREVERRLDESADVEATLKGLEEHSLIMRMLGFDFSTYFFKHITTREVAYQTLLQQNRKMLHQLTAEAIESLFSDRLEEFSFALADHYLRAEDPEKSKPHLHKAIDMAAKVYDNALAIKLTDELLSILEDGTEKAEILIKSADIKWLIGNWAEADLDIVQAASMVSADSLLACEINRFKGIAAFFKGNMDTALADFKQGYSLALKLNDRLQLCIALSNLGIWHQHHKKLVEAIDYHQQSLELAISLNENQRQAKTCSNLGLIYLEQGDFPKAETSLRKSLDIAQSERFLRDESIALGNLAWTLMKQKRFDEAMPYLCQKLALATQMNDKLETIKALGNIGNIHSENLDYAKALEYYEKILALKLQLGNPQEIEITQKVIAETTRLLRG